MEVFENHPEPENSVANSVALLVQCLAKNSGTFGKVDFFFQSYIKCSLKFFSSGHFCFKFNTVTLSGFFPIMPHAGFSTGTLKWTNPSGRVRAQFLNENGQ